LGTGSGILALLLARRLPESRIDAVEIQKRPADLAQRNVELNGLSDQVRVIHGDIANLGDLLKTRSVDLVVSNPPYRPSGSGRLSPKTQRAVARHEVSLDIQALAVAAARLLKHRGRFCMIHLPERMLELLDTLAETGLEPKRLRMVHPSLKKPAGWILLEAVRGARPGLRVESPLVLQSGEGEPTEEFAAICGENGNGRGDSD